VAQELPETDRALTSASVQLTRRPLFKADPNPANIGEADRGTKDLEGRGTTQLPIALKHQLLSGLFL